MIVVNRKLHFCVFVLIIICNGCTITNDLSYKYLDGPFRLKSNQRILEPGMDEGVKEISVLFDELNIDTITGQVIVKESCEVLSKANIYFGTKGPGDNIILRKQIGNTDSDGKFSVILPESESDLKYVIFYFVSFMPAVMEISSG